MGALIETVMGDITKVTDVEAIVNAANNSLSPTVMVQNTRRHTNS